MATTAAPRSSDPWAFRFADWMANNGRRLSFTIDRDEAISRQVRRRKRLEAQKKVKR